MYRNLGRTQMMSPLLLALWSFRLLVSSSEFLAHCMGSEHEAPRTQLTVTTPNVRPIHLQILASAEYLDTQETNYEELHILDMRVATGHTGVLTRTLRASGRLLGTLALHDSCTAPNRAACRQWQRRPGPVLCSARRVASTGATASTAVCVRATVRAAAIAAPASAAEQRGA